MEGKKQFAVVFHMPGSTITSEMLHSPEHVIDPYPLWERMRHDSPVFLDEVTNTWILTRYVDCVAAFANYEDFSNRLYRDTLGLSLIHISEPTRPY